MRFLIEPLVGGLTALIVFIGLSTPIIVIGMIYYYKKRLEHKQIMAAIEKGTPLSEIIPPKPVGLLWIKYLTVGIALILTASGLFGWLYVGNIELSSPFVLVPFIFLAIGIAWLIRGLLYRKHQPQIQSSNKGNTTINNKLSRPSSLRRDEP